MISTLSGENYGAETREGVYLIDFWAPWCGPCRIQSMVLDKVASRFEGNVNIGKCNVDDEPTLAAKFDVRTIPTMVILRDGQEVGRLVGVQPEDVLLGKLTLHVLPALKKGGKA